MRYLRLLGTAVTALLLGVTPLAAQCTPVFSFSVYSDGSVSADETTVYAYTSAEDTSTLCGCVHSAYTAYATVYDPNGTWLGDSQESGFESSVSALTDGVSGNYEVSGAEIAYCNCRQGDVGGGGAVTVAVSCPTTISVAGSQNLMLSNAFSQGYRTGVGNMFTMQVGPGNMNGAVVSELAGASTSYTCPVNPNPTSFSGNFTVGPGNPLNASGSYLGTLYSGSGNNQFLDRNSFSFNYDFLSGQSANYSCTATWPHTFSACNKTIGSFTVTTTFTHSSMFGTPVTLVGSTVQ